MRKLILLSGGLDSCLALVHTLNSRECAELYGLHITYGQRNYNKEQEAAKAIWNKSKRMVCFRTRQEDFYHVRISPGLIPGFGSLTGKKDITRYNKPISLTPRKEYDNAFIPYRNMLFSTIAGMWARKLDCREIVTGFGGSFPDGQPSFLNAMCVAFHFSDPTKKLTITSTASESRKANLVKGLSITGCKELLALSYSCYTGKTPPCGKCLACASRAALFKDIGEQDPALPPTKT